MILTSTLLTVWSTLALNCGRLALYSMNLVSYFFSGGPLIFILSLSRLNQELCSTTFWSLMTLSTPRSLQRRPGPSWKMYVNLSVLYTGLSVLYFTLSNCAINIMICCRLRRLPLTRPRKRGSRRYAELHTHLLCNAILMKQNQGPV